MLVYYYLPKSYAKLGNKQVHGRGLGLPPIHVTYDEYRANKTILSPAPFTPEYFEKVIGKPNFPYRAYITLETIKDIPYRMLQQIATYLDIRGIGNDLSLQGLIRYNIKDL